MPMHVPEPRHLLIAKIRAADRRTRRLDWLDGALIGLGVALTIAWGLTLAWLPFYVARLLWLGTE